MTESDDCNKLLHQAALFDNVDLMESLLIGPARLHIDEQDLYGRTPLYTSITNNSLKCCHLLLMAGANPNIACSQECNGMAPLHVAAKENKKKFLELLLEYNADINMCDNLGYSVIDLAVKYNSKDCADSIQMHVDLQSIKDVEIETTFIEACKLGNTQLARSIMNSSSFSHKVIQTLVNSSSDQEHDLLYCVCRSGHAEMCEYLMSLGAEVRVESLSGLSPVHIACLAGHLDCLDILLKAFPFLITVPTFEGSYPLHLASMQGNLEIVKLLATILLCQSCLDGESSISNESFESALNFRDGNGCTSLHLAVECGSVDVVRFLLEVGSTSEDDDNKEDVLSIKKPLKISKTLMNIDALNGDGKTALHLVIVGNDHISDENCLEILNALLTYGADPNTKLQVLPSNKKEMQYSTPLVEAVKARNKRMVKMLLEFGAKDENSSAIKLSISAEDECLIELFLENLVFNDPENASYVSKQFELLNRNNINKIHNFHNSLTGLKIHWNALGLNKLEQSWFIKNDEKYSLERFPSSPFLCSAAITQLDLSYNLLTTLPSFIWELNNLKKLNVSNNQIKIIEFRNSWDSTLKSEKIEENGEGFKLRITHFDCSACGGPGDNSRHLKTCDLTELLASCTLEEINLQCNKLKTVPLELFKIPCLKKVNISFNQISSLPYNMWLCSSLVELNASHNLLTELPFSSEPNSTFSGLCKNCSGFSQRNNTHSEDSGTIFDDESPTTDDLLEEPCFYHINQWQEKVKVQALFYEEEEYSDISRSTISHLKELDLSFNLFEEIPPGLPCLAYRLEKLFLSNNQITRFGAIQNYPASLEVLDLSRNQISEDNQLRRVSSILSAPISLSTSKLCKSPFCMASSYSPTGSPALSGTRLTSRCSVSSFSSMSFSSSLGINAICSHCSHLQLIKLKTLLLTFNCLKTFTFCCRDEQNHRSSLMLSDMLLRSPMVLFPNLITLDLSNNLIAVFPKEIGYLRNLSTLTMANNKIVECPREVGFLKKLWSLNFTGNPVNETLKSVLGEKMKVVRSVVSYLRSLMDEVVPFNHMKLMLVGKQGTGKTSLLQTLMGDNPRNSHWISRRDRKMKGIDLKGENLSTVGVDIGDLVLTRDGEEVIFSTWDFGGQKEYYATHQYFLSKRSVYLVVWKMPDGEGGVNEIFKWLINIQARAPNSSVVIVGTHLDVAFKNFPINFIEEMAALIERKYIKLMEPGRCGFPKVVGQVMVSCKSGMMSKSNFQRFHEMIWKAVDLSVDNTGARLLDQKVPVSYINLQKTIRIIAENRVAANEDPVLSADQYKQFVIEKMEESFGTSFQDVTELNQATQFLHENGVLLHYDDTNLKDIYFLDPQWLCDMLACIITVRQINGLAINGVMKLDDLPILLKGVAFRSGDIKKYMINLLHKFEVALQWDDIHLLIPSLLPIDKNGELEFVMIPASGEETFQDQIPLPSLCPEINNPQINRNTNPAFSFFRLYTMSYFPSGFWPRLITRMLGDSSYSKLLTYLYDLSDLHNHSVDVNNLPGPCWHCWQTGLELRHLGLPVLRVKEISSSTSPGVFDYSKCHPVMKEDADSSWYSIFVNDNSILEIIVYNESFTLKPCNENAILTFFPVMEVVVRFLTIVVEQIDTLLEDWYPSVGTRFTKDIKGAMLINRLVPCTKCIMDQNVVYLSSEKNSNSLLASKPNLKKQNFMLSSTPPMSKGVSFLRDSDSPSGVVYCFSIEHCIHSAQSNKVICCPRHGILGPFFTANEGGLIHFSHVAPDTVFYDLQPDLIIHPDNLQRTKFLGKGAFGAVYVGHVFLKRLNTTRPVAMKMLKPTIPEDEIPLDLLRLFKKECDLWTRDPELKCCEAYTIARKELSILLDLKHENVVSLVGLCVSPLCLILSLAPLGNLNDHLKSFRKCGLKLALYAVRDVVVQVSSALKYLHSKHVIYRDLKSENILVWSFPDWQLKGSLNPVNVKLADYGVSRVILPSGTKGYAGTLPFMAPEIIMQNGEEAYNEKVDCYSFSLLLYELISLKMPYEGDTLLGTCGINLKSHVLAGGRPVLSLKEAQFPINVLDLMTMCWSSDPQERLSASEIELFARQPEFCSLLDAVTFTEDIEIICAIAIPFQPMCSTDEMSSHYNILLYGSLCSTRNKRKTGSFYMCSFSEEESTLIKKMNIEIDHVTCMCVTSEYVWCATERSVIHIFRASDYTEVTKFPVAESPTGVTCMCRIQEKVCILLDDGNFVFCSLASYSDEGCQTNVLKFKGNGRLVHCILHSFHSNQHLLWCGQTQGTLVLWTVNTDDSLQYVESLHHFPSTEALSDTVHITSSHESSAHFFTFVYPGSIVYRWSSLERQCDGFIDVSQLSSPLFHHSNKPFVNDRFQASSFQVTYMSVIGERLYIGTSFGCVACVDPVLLTPIFICKPHSSELPNICAILPIAQFSQQLSTTCREIEKKIRKTEKCLFVTIGVGHCSLADLISRGSLSRTTIDFSAGLREKFHILVWSDDVFRNSPSQ